MNNDNLAPVGTIYQAHGLKGEMKVSFEAFFVPFFEDLKVLYLQEKGTFLPYFVEKVHWRNQQIFILKLDEVTSKEAATQFNKRSIFVDLSEFEELEDTFEEVHHWDFIINYEALTIDGTSIGIIKDILYMGEQDLAEIQKEGVEHLIPLHNDFIGKIDEDLEQIRFDLPEGMLEL